MIFSLFFISFYFQSLTVDLGTIHKRCPQSGGCAERTLIGKGGRVLQMRTSTIFGAKNFEMFEIYGVSAQTMGEGVNFLRFCADVCYGRPLVHTLIFSTCLGQPQKDRMIILQGGYTAYIIFGS